MKNKLLLFILSCFLSLSLKAQLFSHHNVASQLSQPKETAVADIDGDGNLDIVVPEFSSSTITVLYGTGDISNYTKVTYPLVNPSLNIDEKPWAVVVMDIDGDSNKDIIYSNYANSGSTTDGVYWIQNTGNRNFGSSQLIRLFPRCRHISKANLDADPEDELIVAGDNDGINNLQALNLTQTGGYSSSVLTSVNGTYKRPLHVSHGDLNGDGNLDFVVSAFGNNAVFEGFIVRLAPNYASNFSLSDPFNNLTSGPRQTDLMDFDEDGDLDVVSVDYYGGKSSIVAYQITPSPFASAFYFQLFETNNSRGIVSVTAGDFDNDGVGDFIVADIVTDRILFYENTATDNVPAASINFNPFVNISTSVIDPTWVISEDLDADGDLDVIVSNNNGGTANQGFISVLENNAATLSTDEIEVERISTITSDTDVTILGMPSTVTNGSLYDINGRLVRKGILNTQHNHFSIDGLQPGIYILKLSTLNTSFKIVKQ